MTEQLPVANLALEGSRQVGSTMAVVFGVRPKMYTRMYAGVHILTVRIY